MPKNKKLSPIHDAMKPISLANFTSLREGLQRSIRNFEAEVESRRKKPVRQQTFEQLSKDFLNALTTRTKEKKSSLPTICD